MATAIDPVTPAPPAPSRGIPDTFRALADAFVAWMANLATEWNISIGQVNTVATEIETAAGTAEAAAAAAQATANAVAWVSGTTYSIGNVVWSPINFQSYRRKTAGAGTTDPSADPTNWEQVSFNPLAGPTIQYPQLIALRTKKVAMAGSDIDLNLGDVFTKTISGPTTLTISNVPAADIAVSFQLVLTNGGSSVVTYPAGSKFIGGEPPLSVSGRDRLGFMSEDGGTTWDIVLIGRGFA